MADTQTQVDFDDIHARFAESVRDVMPATELESIAKEFASANTWPKYRAQFSIISAIFYQRITVQVTGDGGKQFVGNAGGIGTPGGGGGDGHIFTPNLARLYAETERFQYQIAVAGIEVNFFNGRSQLLGVYAGGGLSTCLGTGGGTGHW